MRHWPQENSEEDRKSEQTQALGGLENTEETQTLGEQEENSEETETLGKQEENKEETDLMRTGGEQ